MIDVDKAMTSRQMLAVDIDIYQNEKRKKGVLCVI